MARYSSEAARVFLVCFFALFSALCSAQEIEFNRDIRPIFSDRCYTCHGPDQANRKTKLRFDTEAGAKQDLGGGHFAVVAGDAAKSTILQRLNASNPALRMPLGGPALSENEISLIRRWIEQGAKWEKHWSLIPPRRREFPTVSDHAWPKNGIDWFVLNRLEREGLRPSTEASKEALIRRVSLDLTGLPPTAAEVDVSQCLRKGRRPPAGLPPLRRTHGCTVACGGPLCRYQRLSDRCRTLYVALARLGDRRFQSQHALQ
jgi:hypothetical protein